ncbi:MAG: hypothetical protein ACSHXZ_10255 [Gammaproteobacteria bacterium]
MLGKLLFTIIIILLGILWIRRNREQERQEASKAAKRTPEISASPPALNDYRFAAYLFLALMIGSGSYLYYQRWQDDHRLVTVLLHRDGAQSPVTYQVQKSELEERAFTTIDGIRVTVAASERMEVIGL